MDPMTHGMILMWSVFAEMEREITRQRIISGMKNAQLKGKKLGRPEVDKDQLPEKFFKYYALYKNKQMNITEVARVLGVARGTVYNYIRIIERTDTNKKKEKGGQ